MTARVLRLVAALGLLVSSGAAAQVPDTTKKPPADTLRMAGPDSARRDSLHADSVRADTATQTFIRLQDRIRVRVPVAPRLGDDGPRAVGARIVLTRDSLNWSDAETVADLITRVPGTFLWRGGFIGRAEYPNMRGRGAASVEYFLDGLPYLPAGADSVGVDGSLFGLSLFDRIEIEPLPAGARVYLYTRTWDRLAPRTGIAVGTGSGGFTKFSAALESRSRSGFGISLAADYMNTSINVPAAGDYHNTQLVAQLSWVPRPTRGVVLQLTRNGPRRDANTDPITQTIVDTGLAIKRSDLELRAFVRRHANGFGPGVDVIVARTTARDTLSDSLRTALGVVGLEQSIVRAGVVAGLHAPRSSASVSAFMQTRWTSVDVRGRASAVAGGLAGDVEAVYQRHDGGRSSQWVSGHVSAQLLPGITLGGSARVGRLVVAPSILADTAQTVTDLEGSLTFENKWLMARAAVSRTAAFTPPAFQPFIAIPSLGTVPATTWLTASGRITPTSWLTLESWASTPASGTVVGQPRRHALSRGTIRSRFLRTFTQGVFDLKLSAGFEYWDAAVMGFDVSGQAVSLPRTSHLFTQAELQIQSFTLYFYQQNTNNVPTLAYVPGFYIPTFANRFGVRWDFFN